VIYSQTSHSQNSEMYVRDRTQITTNLITVISSLFKGLHQMSLAKVT